MDALFALQTLLSLLLQLPTTEFLVELISEILPVDPGYLVGFGRLALDASQRKSRPEDSYSQRVG